MSEIRSITLPDNVTYDLRDDSKTPQYSTMPTASADYVNKVVQYIGTTGTYINGYFYKCVNNSGTYSWVNQEVQAPASGAPVIGTVTIAAGNTSGVLVDSSPYQWNDNMTVEVFCSTPNTPCDVLFDSSAHTLTVTMQEEYDSSRTFKLVGRALPS